MGYRSFTDESGMQWQAWDIIPRLAERRAQERRAGEAVVATDRRLERDRRQRAGGRVALSAGLHAGWLCFETLTEKRRLTPIPADWLRCAVTTLREYLARAIPVPRTSPAIQLPMLANLESRAG